MDFAGTHNSAHNKIPQRRLSYSFLEDEFFLSIDSLQIPPMSFTSIFTKRNGYLTFKNCKLHKRKDCACLINCGLLLEQ